MKDNIRQTFGDLLVDALRDTGRDVSTVTKEVRDYAVEQMEQLAEAVGQPGFGLAVTAAADNVAMRLGISTVEVADRADARIWGIIAGAIGIGARAIG